MTNGVNIKLAGRYLEARPAIVASYGGSDAFTVIGQAGTLPDPTVFVTTSRNRIRAGVLVRTVYGSAKWWSPCSHHQVQSEAI